MSIHNYNYTIMHVKKEESGGVAVFNSVAFPTGEPELAVGAVPF